MKAQASYDKLVDELIAEIDKGSLIWRQPWFARYPRNLHTGKNYRGVNVFSLNWEAHKRGYKSSSWITRKQAFSRGGEIKAGEESNITPIIFGKWVFKHWKDRRGVEHNDVRLMLLGHEVYNVEQTNGLERLVPSEHHLDFQPLQRAETIISEYKNGPQLTLDPAQAWYSPIFDIVCMPAPSQFISAHGYYATCFHEFIHSTGHDSRLSRSSFYDALSPSTERYAKEELLAEFGAAFLCAESGIINDTIKNSTAYLAFWARTFRDVRTTLFWAASNAQKASDWVLNSRKSEGNTGRTSHERVIPPESGEVRWD